MLSSWETWFQPNLDSLLAALTEVEAEGKSATATGCGEASLLLLPARMAAPWARSTYLVNCALVRSAMTDILYHAVPALFPVLDASVLAKDGTMYQEHTRRQMAAYEQERASLLEA